ncbi:MAG: hypothetical protein WC759_00090 [Candidatus Micrarchaeia archaeon]|jgi:hypothetical protein
MEKVNPDAEMVAPYVTVATPDGRLFIIEGNRILDKLLLHPVFGERIAKASNVQEVVASTNDPALRDYLNRILFLIFEEQEQSYRKDKALTSCMRAVEKTLKPDEIHLLIELEARIEIHEKRKADALKGYDVAQKKLAEQRAKGGERNGEDSGNSDSKAG